MLVRINASTLVNQILDCQFFRDLKFMVPGRHDNPGHSDPDHLLITGRTRAQEQAAQQRNSHNGTHWKEPNPSGDCVTERLQTGHSDFHAPRIPLPNRN
jgi:hypothetical protein